MFKDGEILTQACSSVPQVAQQGVFRNATRNRITVSH